MSALGDSPRGSYGPSGSGRPGTPAGGQPTEPGVLRLSERFPTERCIRWNPLPDSYHLLAEMVRSPGDEYKLVVSQTVLKQVDAHLHAAGDRTAVGLLLGQVYDCPESGVQYTIVRGIERFPEALVQLEEEEITDESWRALEPEIRRHGSRVLGWYRSRKRVTSQLPPLDAVAHMKRFRHPWQTALLVSPDVERPRGAFFVYEARVGRVYTLPFHEMLDVHPLHGIAGARTWVRWQNYVTDADLGLLVEQTQQRAAAAAERAAPGLLDPLKDALEEAWSWVRTQRGPRAETSTPPSSPTTRADRLASRVERKERPATRPSTPGGGSPVHDIGSRSRTPTPPHGVPRLELPSEPRMSPPRGTSRPTAPPQEPEPPEQSPADLRSPLAVLLPPGFYEPAARQEKQRHTRLVAVVGILALAAAAWFVLWPSLRSAAPRSSNGATAPENVAPSASPAAGVAQPVPVAADTTGAAATLHREPVPAGRGTVLPPSAAPPVDPQAALRHFDERVTALTFALGVFRERLGDGAPRECGSVNAARALVSDGFDALGAAMQRAGRSLDVERSMRFNKLAADVSDADRNWRRSRCARTPAP